MSIDDLKIPCDVLTEYPRSTILLYLICYLHADENGFCQRARWHGACAGLTKEECIEAIESLSAGGFIETHKWPDTYGTQTVVRFLNWDGPIIHERIPWSAWSVIRSKVFERDRNSCAYCLTQFPLEELECDHVEPISAGGTNEMGNLVTACRSCNQKKRAQLITNYRKASRNEN